MNSEEASKYFQAIFLDSRLAVDRKIAAIVTRRAASKSLFSGPAVNECFVAVSETTLAAIDDCLAAIGKVTEHNAGLRSKMIAELTTLLPNEIDAIKLRTVRSFESIKSPMKWVEQSFSGLRGKAERKLSDYRAGWTAPAPKPWRERHRFVYDMLLVLLGVAATVLVSVLTSSKNVG